MNWEDILKTSIVYGLYSLTFFAPCIFLSPESQRRSHFVLRLILSTFVLLLFSFLLSFLGAAENAALSTDLPNYLILSLLVVGSLFFISSASLSRIFYSVLCGAFLRQAYSKFASAIVVWSGFDDRFYYRELFYFLFAIVYAIAVYFLVARKISKDDLFKPERQLILLGIVLTLLLYASYLEPYLQDSPAFLISFLFFEGLVSLMLVYVHYYLYVTNARYQAEVQEKEIRENRIKQLGDFQDAIKTVSIKYHDLRYQQEKKEDQSSLNEAMTRVGLFIETGNPALDSVLTERNLALHRAGITLSCSIEKGALSFMNESDITALFGNALDNAKDYLVGIADKDKRFVKVIVTSKDSFVQISIANYFEGSLSFNRDGCPETTKGDSRYHGYGTRSIKAIAEKYGGEAILKVEDSLFKVYLLLPKK
jgi:hypothetical protein